MSSPAPRTPVRRAPPPRHGRAEDDSSFADVGDNFQSPEGCCIRLRERLSTGVQLDTNTFQVFSADAMPVVLKTCPTSNSVTDTVTSTKTETVLNFDQETDVISPSTPRKRSTSVAFASSFSTPCKVQRFASASCAPPRYIFKQSRRATLTRSQLLLLQDPLKWMRCEQPSVVGGKPREICVHQKEERPDLLAPRSYLQEAQIQQSLGASGLAPRLIESWWEPVGPVGSDTFQFCMLMEYVHGVSLSDALSLVNSLQVTHNLCQQAARLIQQLHDVHGVIHGDLQRSHFHVDMEQHRVYLLDFGLSRYGQLERNLYLDLGNDGDGYFHPPSQDPVTGLATMQSDWTALSFTTLYALEHSKLSLDLSGFRSWVARLKQEWQPISYTEYLEKLASVQSL